MKFTAAAALLSAVAVSAVPFKRQDNSTAAPAAAAAPTDTQILQYALTLEHLEKAFYAQALEQYSADDFASAGYPAWVRNRLQQVASHEADHVALLSGALGNSSVEACSYKFPYTDVDSFLSLAATIENVGVSAYAGAAQFIKTPAYVTVAVAIHAVEARHQAWEQSAVLKQQPWNGPYDTPLGLDLVYTIAAGFITGCPDSNPALPVMALPALTVSAGPGQNAQFTFASTDSTTKYAVFYAGLGTAIVQLDQNNMATIPAGLQGYYYAVVTTSADAMGVTNDNIVAGPAIGFAPFNSAASNPTFSG